MASSGINPVPTGGALLGVCSGYLYVAVMGMWCWARRRRVSCTMARRYGAPGIAVGAGVCCAGKLLAWSFQLFCAVFPVSLVCAATLHHSDSGSLPSRSGLLASEPTERGGLAQASSTLCPGQRGPCAYSAFAGVCCGAGCYRILLLCRDALCLSV